MAAKGPNAHSSGVKGELPCKAWTDRGGRMCVKYDTDVAFAGWSWLMKASGRFSEMFVV